MTLKEILADKAKYGDQLAWDLGNGTTVTLGQLRSLSAEDQNSLTKRDADLTKRQADMDAKDAELKRAQNNTANLFVNLQKAQQAIADGKFDTLPPEVKALFANVPVGSNGGNSNTDPFAALSRLEQDTLLGPLVQVIKRVNESATKAQTEAQKVIDIQKSMATNYMNGVLEDRYERLVPADKQEKITLKMLIEDAVRNGEYSSDSTPNLRKAYQRAIAGDVAAAKEADIRADERKKVEAELATRSHGGSGSDIFVPTPANFGLDVHNRSGSAPKPFKNLDEAFAAAANDKDIWANVDQTVQ